MDAYLFVREADQRVVGSLRALVEKKSETGIRFVTPLFGAFDALVAVECRDLDRLALAKREIQSAGATNAETLIAIEIPPIPPIPPPMPSHEPPPKPAVEAFVGIRVEPGRGQEVRDIASKVSGVRGIATVAGIFDILLELGGETFEEVSRALFEDLQHVSGIASMTSSFATFGRAASAS